MYYGHYYSRWNRFCIFIADEWFPLLCFGGCAALLVLGFSAAYEDAKRWEAFKVEHHCKIVGRMNGDVSFGNSIAPNGQVGIVVTQTPDKTGWQCDDGITYWR